MNFSSPSSSPVSSEDFRFNYIVKYFFLLFLITFDIGINSSADSSASFGAAIAYTAIQGILRIFSLFLVFIFMWPTFVFKYGLFGILYKRFRLLLLFLLLTIIFLLALRITRILEISSKTPIEMWETANYFPLYIIHNLICFGFYFALMKAGFELANPIFYKPEQWIQ